jgi:phosphoribosylamine---glycine ligase
VNVLIVGSGGREHALAWKTAQSPLAEKIYCAPGNPGMARYGECVPIQATDFDALIRFAKDHAVGLTIVGPEDPLAHGIVDGFDEAGLVAFGPHRAAARLEASKSFAKQIMANQGIPTAAYQEFNRPGDAIAYVREADAPLVVKADGLAAGKGVTVAQNREQAVEAIRSMMVERVFGAAGSSVIVEERLEGEEASILAFTDGETVLPMVPSQDHKPVYDKDAGPNTGGMGAYSPAPVVTDAMLAEIQERILTPCIQGLARQGIRYAGVLYAGLMITDDGPKVVEFNCRFGDPEVQVVLPRLKTDLVPVLEACCKGRLDTIALEWDHRACVTVVMASGGYPGPYAKGKPITGIEEAERQGALVFHAGTQISGDRLATNGGRVLDVTALGPTIPDAVKAAYAGVESIHFDGAHYRRDIGKKALARLETQHADPGNTEHRAG